VQRICERVGLPLMVHHNFSTVPIGDCPGADSSPVKLRAGDIYTHAFHGLETHIIDQSVEVRKKNGLLKSAQKMVI
jgi:predicted amidohydrolase